ncbi:MAG: homocysteine S-methyltransferase family protein, partial [Clostridia bacterium]|nr:homocysteine S-methyltransferase family protein [Clostridia bacterium]
MLPAFIFDSGANICDQFESHIEAGANIIVAPTYLFNSENPKKKAISETVKASKEKIFIAGAVCRNPEKTVFSDGRISYDTYYNIIKEEVSFIYKTYPVSFIFLLGFDSLAEAKYAVYATKEVCDLPICLCLDFADKDTLADGCDVPTAVITLQSLGISALGFSGNGPDAVYDVLLSAKEFASVPLFAIPDANEFIAPFEFCEYAHDFVNNKCVMFAGGRGTDERFTAEIAKELWQLEPFMPDFPTVNAICGKNGILFMDFENNVISKNKELIEIDLEGLTNESEVDEMILKIKKAGFPPICFKSKELG